MTVELCKSAQEPFCDCVASYPKELGMKLCFEFWDLNLCMVTWY